MNLVDSTADLVFGAGEVGIKRTQVIPDEFLRDLADARAASVHNKMGDYARVASIPVVIVDRWFREGFNIYQEPIRAVVARLKREGLDHFLATERRV